MPGNEEKEGLQEELQEHCKTWSRSARNRGVVKNLPDNPKRFTQHIYLLTRQSFFSGRFYFEVQVKDKTAWCIGVARESIDRKCQIIGTPEMGYWTLYFNKDELLFDNYPAVRLPLRAELQKVGMFVDYDGSGLPR